MAIYSLNISSVNREKGSNACKTLSYITGKKIYDNRLGQTHNYGRNERVVFSKMILPLGATFRSDEELINSIEQYETNDKSIIAKKVMVALPIEFNLEQQKEVVEKFIEENFTSNGYASVYAIHDIDSLNPHAHILVPARQIDEQGNWKERKAKKEYALDDKQRKVPVLDKEKIKAYEKATGKEFNPNEWNYDELCDQFQKIGSRNRKQWKRVNVEVNKITEKGFLKGIRADWSTKCNELLPTDNKIDHRSFKERGIDDMEPTIHKGYKTTAIENKGGWNERLERHADIQIRNYEIRQDINFLSKNMRILKENINERIRTFETRIRSLGTRIEEFRERTTKRLNEITSLITRTETRQRRIEELRNTVRMARRRIRSIEEWTISAQVEQKPISTPQMPNGRMDLNSIKERAKKRAKTDKRSINNPFNVYFNQITKMAIREQGDTRYVLEYMLENDNKFNRWANSISDSEWADFRDSIYDKVDEKMKEFEHDDYDEPEL